MKYEYKGVTNKNEIEVDEEWGRVLLKLDNEEINSNRKHSRRHPISLDDTDYEGEWFADGYNAAADVLTKIDIEQALTSLTELQKICFVEVCLSGRSERTAAADLSITQQMVDKHVQAARKKLKNLF